MVNWQQTYLQDHALFIGIQFCNRKHLSLATSFSSYIASSATARFAQIMLMKICTLIASYQELIDIIIEESVTSRFTD